jgi:energy-converting hydrogenase Eha subunit G
MLNLNGVRQREEVKSSLISEDIRRQRWFWLGIFIAAEFVNVFIPSGPVCAVLGLATGIVMWLVTRKDERMAWTVVFGLLFALIFTMNASFFPHVEQVAYFMAGVGLVLLVTGAISLVRYLRGNPARQA